MRNQSDSHHEDMEMAVKEEGDYKLQSFDGSNESLGKKQRLCRLSFESIKPLDISQVTEIDALPPNDDSTDQWIQDAIPKFIDTQLKDSLSALRDSVSQTKQELEAWIKESFEVDNLEQQIYVLNAKRRLSEASGEDVVTDSRSGKQSRTVSTSSEDKPRLRLKLSDRLDSQTKSNSPDSDAKQSAPRGSKNLGRMARPQPEAVDLKPKVPNQVPIATFWNYIEQYFKRIDENDVKYLDDPAKVVDPIPFCIPPLGRAYSEQWRDAYGFVTGSVGMRPLPAVSCSGSLTDRLLSMLIDLNAQVPLESDDADGEGAVEEKVNRPHLPSSLEDRLRKDLVEHGFLSARYSVDAHEDDQICAELRRLQQSLRTQSMLNQYRKRRLAEHVRTHVLPAQELYGLIDELDRQIVTTFQKMQRAKKKSGSASKKTEAPVPSGGIREALRLIESREKLLTAFAHIVGDRQAWLEPRNERLFDEVVENRLVKESEASWAMLL